MRFDVNFQRVEIYRLVRIRYQQFDHGNLPFHTLFFAIQCANSFASTHDTQWDLFSINNSSTTIFQLTVLSSIDDV